MFLGREEKQKRGKRKGKKAENKALKIEFIEIQYCSTGFIHTE